MEEQKEPENMYQAYLHKQVSSLTRGKGSGENFKDLIGDMIWKGHFEKRFILAGKHTVRYDHLEKMSDDWVKKQSMSDDQYQNIFHNQPMREIDPVIIKLNEIYNSIISLGETIDDMAGVEIRDKITDLQEKIWNRKMTESEYNYFLNTSEEQILLKLELENSDLYATRSQDKPEEKKATRPIVFSEPKTIKLKMNRSEDAKHETSIISLDGIFN
jgi:polyhydroxyalkanoate synthesis regulator phasin